MERPLGAGSAAGRRAYCCGALSGNSVQIRPAASGRRVQGRGCRRRVGSGSSIRALERTLSRIKLTMTWQGSLGPQRPMPDPLPQQAISLAGLSRQPWRF